MRKPPEAENDRAIAPGRGDGLVHQRHESGWCFRPQPPEAGESETLIPQPFGMQQRHMEEQPFERGQHAIEAALQAVAAQRHGSGVILVGARRAAPGVTGELVEQQDQRQPPARGSGPAVEPSRAGPLDIGAEAIGDRPIER